MIVKLERIDRVGLPLTMHVFTGFGGLTFLCYQLLARFMVAGGIELHRGRHLLLESIALN
jgi:hypothetical protein